MTRDGRKAGSISFSCGWTGQPAASSGWTRPSGLGVCPCRGLGVSPSLAAKTEAVTTKVPENTGVGARKPPLSYCLIK